MTARRPWIYCTGRDATLEQKLGGMERFAEDVIGPLAVDRELTP
jgi:hypothetical protein